MMASREPAAVIDARTTRVAHLVHRAATLQANLHVAGEVTPAGLVAAARAGFTVDHDGRAYRVTVEPLEVPGG
jgi:hypothetical protein